jgi:hypothetical protein
MRSSQPPTWVSPMKICGTVRRPVSAIICSRCGRVEVDADLLDLLDAALLEQRLGAHAVRADLRGVHLDGVHGATLPVNRVRIGDRRSRTVVACRPGRDQGSHRSLPAQALAPTCAALPALGGGSGDFSRSAGWPRARPPAAGHGATAFRSRPCAAARGAAGARAGRAHHHQRQALLVGRSLDLRALPNGTLRAPAAWPAAYSAGSLTSISTPFSRLIRRTASAGADGAATAAALDHRPHQHAAGDEGHEDQDPVLDEEAHGVRRAEAKAKPRIIEFALHANLS